MWLTRPVRSSPEHKQKQSALASERGFVTRQVQSVQKPTVCDCDSFIWDVSPRKSCTVGVAILRLNPILLTSAAVWGSCHVSILFAGDLDRL